MREGALLGGRYRLVDQIAVGGMGEVWRADDETLGRRVAVKALKAEYAEDPTFVERFRAEARNTAMLTHPGIATVYDYGELPVSGARGDSAYLVMELVPGRPLSAVLAEEGPLTPERTMNIVGQAALALQAAHEAGVVHRDVKPGNLLVTDEGVVKVTDFGIARATDAVPLTQTGTVLGTAFYLSPEQAAGDDVGPASDIYSLGVVAYECLAGRRPFAGTNPVAVALAHQREQPPPLAPQVPQQVRELVARAMAKNPPDRPATAGQFGRAALALRDGLRGTRAMPAMGLPPTARMAGGSGTAVLPRTGPPPGRRPAPGPAPIPAGRRKSRLRAPLVGLILLALILGIVAFVHSRSSGTPVTDVKGLTYTRAEATLTRQGFKVAVDGSKSGVVQTQDPAADKRASKGSTVTLTFGSGDVAAAKTQINKSDYLNRRLAEVKADLAAKGFGVSLSGSTNANAIVTAISPTGQVTNGSVISVRSKLPSTATPTPARTTSSPSDSSSGSGSDSSSDPSGSGSDSDSDSGSTSSSSASAAPTTAASASASTSSSRSSSTSSNGNGSDDGDG